MPRNIADGAECLGADLSRPFRDLVGHGEDLARMLIEEKMIFAEMGIGHVSVEMFGLEVERKYVCQ